MTRARRLTRRLLLGSLLGASLRPALARPTNPDVVIIGAGAAGIAAARTLLAEGFSVLLTEATGHIGGRARTDSRSLDAPFDLGCAWLHGAGQNPFLPLARAHGFTPVLHAPEELLFRGNRRASRGERAAYDAAWEALETAVSAAGAAGRDVSVASVSPRNLPWIGTAENWLGPLDMGQEVDNVSCLDWYQMADAAPNMLLAEGFGNLVARLGRGLPVRLNTPVRALDWSGRGVVVATDAGDIRARAALLTPSTGVLGSGAIRFAPALPLWKQQAFDDLPMGLLAKVALQFGADHFGIDDDSWLVRDTPAGRAMFFLCWPLGSNMIIGFAGGDLAWELEGMGARAARAHALAALAGLLGSGVRRHFRHAVFTDWGRNPWTLGAYAGAPPGSAGARADAARPLGKRLFFAGEAMGGAHAQTCAGAWLSGQRAAREVARALG